MSLSTVKLSEIVKKQYYFKMKANIGLFSSLIALQLFGILFSMGGTGSSGGSFYTTSFYSADFMIGFTMIWAFMISTQLMSKDYRNHDFTVVTTRLTTNLSNVAFLLTASVVGAITVFLSGYLLKVIVYFSFKAEYINAAITPTPKQFVFGLTAMFLYIFLFSMLGYFVGAVIQLNKAFIVLLPVLFIGFLIMSVQDSQFNFLLYLFDFYSIESVFFLFLLKVTITSSILIIGTIILSNRLEVKQ